MSRRFPVAFLRECHFPVVKLESAERQRETGTVARPSAMFIPEGYEPNYPYPLIVWFHDTGENERVLARVMRQISDRNAAALALRGERALATGGYTWSSRAETAREQALLNGLRRLRRRCHVHTERIILAGRGMGAVAAAEFFFRRPNWFGGLALLDPAAEAFPTGLIAREELAGKPVLLDLPVEQIGQGRDGASRLAAAGLDVTLRHARSGPLCQSTLRYLNRWLMGAVCGVPV
jgi:phospholipase/carboxylesterase